MYCSNSHFIPLLYAFQHSFKSRFQEATPCCLPHLALLLRSQVPGPPPAFSCPPRRPWALPLDSAGGLLSAQGSCDDSWGHSSRTWILPEHPMTETAHWASPSGYFERDRAEAQSSSFHPSRPRPSSYGSHVLRAPPDKSLFFTVGSSILLSSISPPPSTLSRYLLQAKTISHLGLCDCLRTGFQILPFLPEVLKQGPGTPALSHFYFH